MDGTQTMEPPNANAAPDSNAAAPDKKPRKVKPSYPGLLNGTGNAQKLSAWPADYDAGTQKALKKDDFVDRTVWYVHHAEALETQARKLREEAEEEKMYGDPETRKRAKKVKAIKNQMDELVKQLTASGVDVEELLASMDD